MKNSQTSPQKANLSPSPYSPFTILFILLLATFLRLFQLPTLPPGLNFDEAGSGVAALEILSGAPKIWWRLGGGQEPLWPYLAALSTAGLGNIPLALRLPAALTGVLTVAAVYRLLLTLRPGTWQESRFIALSAALSLALCPWHLHFSRLGFRAILLPLFSTLAFYFLWRSLISSQKSDFTYHVSCIRHHASRRALFKLLTIAALFTALAIYSYLAARLLPLVPLLYWLLHWLVKKIRQPLFPLLPTPYFLLPTLYFLLLLLFLSPLILYFTLNPADFVARSTTVSIFNPAWHKGDVGGTLWQTLTVTLGAFLGLTGDPNPLVNLPGQPAVSLFLAPFFCLGLLINLYRIFTPAPLPPRPSASLHLFLLCWWAVMLLPAILAPEGAPHHLRLLGAIVPTYAFVAIGLNATAKFLSKVISSTSPFRFYPLTTYYLLPTAFSLLLAFQTYTHYFIRWPASVDFTLPFDLYAVRLAGDIAQAPPSTGYVLPMDLRAGEEARHYTLDYLLWPTSPSNPPTLQSSNPPTLPYLPVDERTTAARLTELAQGKARLRVVRWTADKHQEADAKEMVTFLLETTAQFQGRESFPVYDIETYTLPSRQTVFTLPVIDQPIGAVFANLLRLDTAFVPATAKPGTMLPVALSLTPLASMEADYKASLRLTDTAGTRIVQKDRVLLHNFHQGTSLWPPEPVNEYYLLHLPPEMPSGVYTVTVVIYHPETLDPLMAAGLAEVSAGHVAIE